MERRCGVSRPMFVMCVGQATRSWRRWVWRWPLADRWKAVVNGPFVKPLGRWSKMVYGV